jgi:beta-mannosidase
MLHYMARRFFLPLNVVAIPDTATGDIVFKGINDSGGKAQIGAEILAASASGETRRLFNKRAKLDPDRAVEITRIPAGKLNEGEFLFFSWTGEDGKLLGENDFFPRAYKYYELPHAEVSADWSSEDGAPVLTLSADRPALFVTATSDVPGYFSDNAVTLLPGRETRLTFTPRQGGKVNAKALAKGLRIGHLRQTY